jgi:hypothetical protein
MALFKGNDFPWLRRSLFGCEVEEGQQFDGASLLLIGHLAAVLSAFSTSASLIFKQFHLNNHFPLQHG